VWASNTHTHTHTHLCILSPFTIESPENSDSNPSKTTKAAAAAGGTTLAHRKNIIYRSTIPRSCACGRSPAKRECRCLYIITATTAPNPLPGIPACYECGEDDSDGREVTRRSLKNIIRRRRRRPTTDVRPTTGRRGRTTIYVRYNNIIITLVHIYYYVICCAGVGQPRNSKSLINHQRMWHYPVAASVFTHIIIYYITAHDIYIYMCACVCACVCVCVCVCVCRSRRSADGFQLTGSTWNVRLVLLYT